MRGRGRVWGTRCAALLLTVAGGAMAQPPGPPGPFVDGYRLAAWCASVGVPDGYGRRASIDAARCSGYIAGIIDACYRMSDSRPCLPEWVTPAQLAPIVLRHLERHPQLLARSGAEVVKAALEAEYGSTQCPLLP